MGSTKEKRRGGIRDESVIYIGYSRHRLIEMLAEVDRRLGVTYIDTLTRHIISVVMPELWRKYKKIVRKHIDGWQQELPLF